MVAWYTFRSCNCCVFSCGLHKWADHSFSICPPFCVKEMYNTSSYKFKIVWKWLLIIFKSVWWTLHRSAVLAYSCLALTCLGGSLKPHCYHSLCMSGFTKWYYILLFVTHLKLGSNIAEKNVLQVYMTTTTVVHALTSHTARTWHQPESGSNIKLFLH